MLNLSIRLMKSRVRTSLPIGIPIPCTPRSPKPKIREPSVTTMTYIYISKHIPIYHMLEIIYLLFQNQHRTWTSLRAQLWTIVENWPRSFWLKYIPRARRYWLPNSRHAVPTVGVYTRGAISLIWSTCSVATQDQYKNDVWKMGNKKHQMCLKISYQKSMVKGLISVMQLLQKHILSCVTGFATNTLQGSLGLVFQCAMHGWYETTQTKAISLPLSERQSLVPQWIWNYVLTYERDCSFLNE